jgi:hypothetical protein
MFAFWQEDAGANAMIGIDFIRARDGWRQPGFSSIVGGHRNAA